MEKEFKLIKEWIVNYIKNRDILTKTIESIEENKDDWDLVVRTKTGKKYFLIMPIIEDFNEILKKLDKGAVTVVVLNTKKNLNSLIENWDNVIDYPKFCIMFVNPYSELEKKWTIYPHTHEKVTGKASLAKGLKAMFQTVDSWK